MTFSLKRLFGITVKEVSLNEMAEMYDWQRQEAFLKYLRKGTLADIVAIVENFPDVMAVIPTERGYLRGYNSYQPSLAEFTIDHASADKFAYLLKNGIDKDELLSERERLINHAISQRKIEHVAVLIDAGAELRERAHCAYLNYELNWDPVPDEMGFITVKEQAERLRDPEFAKMIHNALDGRLQQAKITKDAGDMLLKAEVPTAPRLVFKKSRGVSNT